MCVVHQIVESGRRGSVIAFDMGPHGSQQWAHDFTEIAGVLRRGGTMRNLKTLKKTCSAGMGRLTKKYQGGVQINEAASVTFGNSGPAVS